MELLYSSENKYIIFAIYITNIILLYRISKNKDLAIGESNSVLRAKQIHIPRRQPAVKKKKDETKILNPEAIRRIMCVGGTRNNKNTRENNIRQKGY